jgi:hypothetical protein
MNTNSQGDILRKKILTVIIIFHIMLSLLFVTPPVYASDSTVTNSTQGPIIISNSTSFLTGALPNFANTSQNANVTMPQNRREVVHLDSEPASTPRLVRYSNGSYMQSLSPLWSSHWWKIDFWTNSPYDRPSQLTGSFRAEENTIGNMAPGDEIMYIPLNVLYGNSVSDAIWFQFVIAFYANNDVVMTIWDINTNNAVYISHDVPTDQVPYIPGDTYNVALIPSGTNTVTFSIQNVDTSDSWTKSEWDWDVPSLTMLYDTNYFSPASAVEGYTTNGQLNNLPYVQTYVGDDIPGNWYSEYGSSAPSGIITATSGGPGNYYWMMFSQTYVASVYDSNHYGLGAVSNPSGLTGSYADGNYAYIYGGNYGDGGYILGNMSTVAGGNIGLWVYSSPGYYSNLYVYVSYDGYDWITIGQIQIWRNYPILYTIGTANTGFKYIGIAGYDSGLSVALHIDVVVV